MNFAMRKHHALVLIAATWMYMPSLQAAAQTQRTQTAEQRGDAKRKEVPIEETNKFIAKTLANAKPTVIDAIPGMGPASDAEIRTSLAAGKQAAERELSMMRPARPAPPP